MPKYKACFTGFSADGRSFVKNYEIQASDLKEVNPIAEQLLTTDLFLNLAHGVKIEITEL
jgi:hypothetical protein